MGQPAGIGSLLPTYLGLGAQLRSSGLVAPDVSFSLPFDSRFVTCRDVQGIMSGPGGAMMNGVQSQSSEPIVP